MTRVSDVLQRHKKASGKPRKVDTTPTRAVPSEVTALTQRSYVDDTCSAAAFVTFPCLQLSQ
jgi:hypothetical protein